MNESSLKQLYDAVSHCIKNAKTDEEQEFCARLCDAFGRKVREAIESLPPDERDEACSVLTKEQWASTVADDIKGARDAGNFKAAQMMEEMLGEAFEQKTITRH